MVSLHTYIDEIDKNYKEIQSLILGVYPKLDHIITQAPSNKLFILSIDILKRLISNIKILRHIKYNEISCVSYRLILRASIADIIEAIYFITASDLDFSKQMRYREIEFVGHLYSYLKDSFRFHNNINPGSLKGIKIEQLKDQYPQYVDTITGDFLKLGRKENKMSTSSMIDQLISKKIISKEFKQLYSNYRLLSFTEHYCPIGRRYSYNEKNSILLIANSVRWILLGVECLCSFISETISKFNQE